MNICGYWAYPKFELGEKAIEYLIYREILPYFEMIAINERPEIVRADPSDDKFVHCAVSAGAAYIISGDRHLLSLAFFDRIPILTVDRFLQTLSS